MIKYTNIIEPPKETETYQDVLIRIEQESDRYEKWYNSHEVQKAQLSDFETLPILPFAYYENIHNKMIFEYFKLRSCTASVEEIRAYVFNQIIYHKDYQNKNVLFTLLKLAE